MNLIIIAIVFSALCAIYVRHNNKLKYYDYLKPATTILIIILALIGCRNEMNIYSLLILIGLVFSLGGDILLLRKKFFVYGLGSFLIAHIMFTLGVVTIAGVNFNLIPLIILAAIGISYFSYLNNSLDKYKIPVLLYFVAIIIMMHQSVSLAVNSGAENNFYYFIATASILFAFSDGVIAYNKFIKEVKIGEILILSTYWTSILIFAFSIFKI